MNLMQEVKRLKKENKKLVAKVEHLEEFLSRGLPHKEVLDAYVRFVNMIGRREQEAIMKARQEFFTVLEIWLQTFLNKTEATPCDPQTESGASPSEQSETTSESTSEATPTEPSPSSPPESATEPGSKMD